MDNENLIYPREIRDTAIEWRLRNEAGDLSLEDLAEFEAWHDSDPRHADAYDRATTVWAALGTLSRDRLSERHFRPSWSTRLQESLQCIPNVLNHPRLARPAFAAAIALVIVAVIAIPQFLQPSETMVAETPALTPYSTGIGETTSVTLSDRSIVTLGAATEIEVTMSSTLRQVTLVRGAAIFDVATEQDREFSVSAGNLTMRVLGTVFDVRNNGGVVRLAVAEGKVEASHRLRVNDALPNLTSREELRAGQNLVATATTGLSAIGNFRKKTFATWLEGRLRYEGATLRELVADANRYSKKPISIDPELADFDDIRATVSFDVKDIDSLLITLTDIFPVQVNEDRSRKLIVARKPG
ncbi:MAG: FecR domain-containing protein [Pseudomonadota bacterium]